MIGRFRGHLPVLKEKPRKKKVTRLTYRQKESLLMMCRGLTNKEISTEMRISESAVRGLHRMVYQKIGTDNRVSAVLHAIRRGWFNPLDNV